MGRYSSEVEEALWMEQSHRVLRHEGRSPTPLFCDLSVCAIACVATFSGSHLDLAVQHEAVMESLVEGNDDDYLTRRAKACDIKQCCIQDE